MSVTVIPSLAQSPFPTAHVDGSDPLAMGGVLVVAGPDGAGKSTLCHVLTEEVLAGRQVRHLHFRPGVLPYATRSDGPVTEPHRDPPYSPVRATLKTVYTFADFIIGWTLRIRPFVRRGGWVVLERGWWDQAIDPRRYRLRERSRLVGLLGHLLPDATLTLILEGPVEVLRDRKRELSADELERQMRAWHDVPPPAVRRVYLDATRPVHELGRSVRQELDRVVGETPAGRRHDFVALPPLGSPRWLVPRGPRRAAMGGLRIYQPVTTRAQLAWELSSALASVGAFRLLPRQQGELPGLRSLPDWLLPPDGYLAIAKTNHPGRFVVLTLGEGGEPRRVAKLAFDAEGRRKLAREGDAIETFGRHMSAPLLAPRLVGRGEGFLLLEAVAWRRRVRPWRLPEDVALAMGRLSRAAGAIRGDRFAAHGDFAPWNLLRTGGGWVLMDWEDADSESVPYFDLFHWLVQSHVLLGRPSTRALLTGIQGQGWIRAATKAYARGAGLAERDAVRFFRVYLRESARRADARTAEGRMSLDARRVLMDALSRRESGE